MDECKCHSYEKCTLLLDKDNLNKFFLDKDEIRELFDVSNIYSAITLSVSLIFTEQEKLDFNEGKISPGTFTKKQDSGWTIQATPKRDYYAWINCFSASHDKYGSVRGNFEHLITYDSKEGFDHFLQHHRPEIWDYHEN